MRTTALRTGIVTAVLTMLVGWASPAAEPATRPAAATTGPGRTTNPEEFTQLKWDTGQKGRQIDLRQYKRTFNDDFKAMDIVKDDSAPGPGAVWFSPGHGAFRTNAPLRADGPFTLVDDGVRLRVDRAGNKWLGACMATVNTKGQGFAQLYGYFEATIRYDYTASGTGFWGAFWAKSQKDYFTDGTTTRTEIGFNEFYGDDGYHASVHLWAAAKPQPRETITRHIFSSGFKDKLGPDVFKNLKVDGAVKGFHAYGGEITPQWVIIYFDRKELGRFPTME
jgi:hypothetical protein